MPGGSPSAAPHGQLLAKNGLYASMWNRQREAQEARERARARSANDAVAPNRTPPPVDDDRPTTARRGGIMLCKAGRRSPPEPRF